MVKYFSSRGHQVPLEFKDLILYTGLVKIKKSYVLLEKALPIYDLSFVMVYQI